MLQTKFSLLTYIQKQTQVKNTKQPISKTKRIFILPL